MSAALEKAVSRLMSGRLEDARRSSRKVLEQEPDHPQALLLMAEICRRMGDEKAAARAEVRALSLQSGWTPAQLAATVGALYDEFGKSAEAAERYQHALGLDAGFAEARERLVRLLFRERRFDDLEPLCREGLQRFPRVALYAERLAAAAWYRGRREEALAGYADAMRRATTDEERQDVGASQAIVLLALGRYAEGWQAYRWRHSRSILLDQGVRLMPDPERLAALTRPAHIRICAEQGLGDEIFFLRFAAALQERGHRLSFAGDARLAPLLPPFLQPDGADAEHLIGSGDLPLAAGREFAPPLALAVDAARRARMEATLRAFGPPPYVGVTWRAGLQADDPKPRRGMYLLKEVDPAALGRAIAPAAARVVVLQRKSTNEDLARFRQGLGREVLDLSAANDDLQDALALLSVLDDYVGVSNTNMHLRAGIAGRKTRVLERMPPEWRWGLEESGSPWFPGFRVYRLPFGEEWGGVLGRLEQDLAATYAAPQHK